MAVALNTTAVKVETLVNLGVFCIQRVTSHLSYSAGTTVRNYLLFLSYFLPHEKNIRNNKPKSVKIKS